LRITPDVLMEASRQDEIMVAVEVAKMSLQQAQSKAEMPIAEVVRLIDLVNYQEGAVVSRTVVKRTTGTVTVFAFDEGQGLSEHTAAFDAVAHLLEGEAEITVSGKPLRTKAGEAVLMPANQPHSLRALSRFKMLLTMIRS
jgi:quercetin dioxygenase-like cupin family protein